MHDAGTGGEPLDITLSEASSGSERVRMIDEPGPDVGDGLESAVRMLGEAGHHRPVIHPPTVAEREIHTQLTTFEGRSRAQTIIARRIDVEVMGAEEERIDGRPVQAEFDGLQHRVVRHGVPCLACCVSHRIAAVVRSAHVAA